MLSAAMEARLNSVLANYESRDDSSSQSNVDSVDASCSSIIAECRAMARADVSRDKDELSRLRQKIKTCAPEKRGALRAKIRQLTEEIEEAETTATSEDDTTQNESPREREEEKAMNRQLREGVRADARSIAQLRRQMDYQATHYDGVDLSCVLRDPARNMARQNPYYTDERNQRRIREQERQAAPPEMIVDSLMNPKVTTVTKQNRTIEQAGLAMMPQQALISAGLIREKTPLQLLLGYDPTVVR